MLARSIIETKKVKYLMMRAPILMVRGCACGHIQYYILDNRCTGVYLIHIQQVAVIILTDANFSHSLHIATIYRYLARYRESEG
jgi:hypothetical protein